MKIQLNKNDHAGQVADRLSQLRKLHERLAAVNKMVVRTSHGHPEERNKAEQQLLEIRNYLASRAVVKVPFEFKVNDVVHTAHPGAVLVIVYENTDVRITIDRRDKSAYVGASSASHRLIRNDALESASVFQGHVECAEKVVRALNTYGIVEVDAETEGQFLECDFDKVMYHITERETRDTKVREEQLILWRMIGEIHRSVPAVHSITSTKKGWFQSLFGGNS